ncbi:MAG TPA: hypothetical protein VGR02_19785 [Thermoanaerobaculia bacterium]|jgi:hypothetical protein|nr:hypothetical protein [Thermoanaerobaculia bacterium]
MRWFGIAAGPLAFALDFQLRYALVPWACRTGQRWAITWISAPLLVVALLGLAASLAAARRTKHDLVAILGAMLNAAFALSIIALTIPDFYFAPCQ